MTQNITIKISKVQNQNTVNQLILQYGEPIYIKNDNRLLIGDGTSTVQQLITNKKYLEPPVGTIFYDSTNTVQYQASIPTTDNSKRIANTEFVNTLINSKLAELVDTKTGNPQKASTITSLAETAGKLSVTFEPIEINPEQIKDSGLSTQTPLMAGTAAVGSSKKWAREDHVHPSDTSKANLNSPAFTGTPTAPTVQDSDNSTKIATTAYVTTKTNQITAGLNNKADINNPAFTGIPTAPTAAAGTDTTQIATTAFVKTAVNNKSVVESKSAVTGQQFYVCGVQNANGNLIYNTGVYVNTSNRLIGAGWNDIAEYRRSLTGIEPGTVVSENGLGCLCKSRENYQLGSYIVSDTFGFAVGNENDLPVAIAGRVLAKYSGNMKNYKIGRPVAAGKDGKIIPVSRIKSIICPECIIGYVSEIPDYNSFNGVAVNNRIWIRVK